MNECEASPQEKCNPEKATLTIEKASLGSRLKRGLFCEDGFSCSFTFGTLAILAFWALVYAYIIYVYAFNYGNWDPNYRNYCNRNGVNNCG